MRRGSGDTNPYLELTMYCNRLQLGTRDALYSDGDAYTPAVTAVNHLKEFLPSVKDVLVLGSGLGSMVQVMDSRGYMPRFTLVEKDKVVLQWAMELLPEKYKHNIKPVCDDAQLYMARNTAQADLIFIDIFDSRVVPDFVFTNGFLELCRGSLLPGGRVAFNYIVNDEQQWEGVRNTFSVVFADNKVVKSGVNRILIGW